MTDSADDRRREMSAARARRYRERHRERLREYYAARARCPKALQRARERQALLRQQNPEAVNAGKRASRDNNIEAYREAERARYHARKDEISVLRRARYQNCPRIRTRDRVSAAMRRSLKTGKAQASCFDLLDYTLADLIAHLEAKFAPGMGWHNMGQWHIDHIQPLASFDIQSAACTQFKRAWALANLQPLWAVENLRKGARIGAEADARLAACQAVIVADRKLGSE